MNQTENTIGTRLRIAREKSGLSQRKLAESLGIAYQTLNKYEKNHRVPGAEIVRQIANITKEDPGWILTGEERVARAESREAGEDHSMEEQVLVRMLIEIIRGRNTANREAIKSNIKAFWLSRNMGDPQEEEAARSAMPERPREKRRRAAS